MEAEMEYRTLGSAGLKVSILCMGTMQFGWSVEEAESHQILSHSFEAGINFLDSADIYSNWVEGNPGGVAEEIIGRWVKQAGIPREQIVIATKARGRMGESPNDEGLSRAHLLQAVEASLRRLGTDYIDLYQLHWPDRSTPIEETLRALDDLVHQGKVRYLGVSNFTAWELMQALWTSDKFRLSRFDALQPHYNLIHRAEFERELRAVCQTYELGVIPYSPLAGGFLTGKYRRGVELPESRRAESRQKLMTEENFRLIDEVETIAKTHGASVSQVALAWLLADPVVTSPIIGATTIAQLDENLGALELQLTDEERSKLDSLTDWNDAK
jgi:aryl-alcohol dehydrogenase-like predicted oxidoreductase